jgi:hypothetical protein
MEPVDTSSSAPAECHVVRFYENEKSLARIVAEFLQEGFEGGNPGIVVATAGQRAEIIRALEDRPCDVVALERSDDLVLLDAEETLSAFMIRGRPDAHRFMGQMSHVIRRVCRDRTACTVRIFGQTVDILWRHGKRDAAIRLEGLWNQLAQTTAFSLLCGYAIGNFYKDGDFKRICDQHSHVLVAEGNAMRLGSPSPLRLNGESMWCTDLRRA